MSHEILSSLPLSLRRRFASLDKYTKEIADRQLEDRNLTKKRRREFLRDHLVGIQGAVLAISVCRYLEDGIAAAEGAITIARSLNVDGFTVGNTDFSEKSADLAQWRELHSALEALLKEYAIDHYATGRHAWDHVSNMLKALLDGKVD